MTRLILAALTVGSLTLPAAGAVQTTSASKASHKTATGSAAAKSTTGATKKRSGKSVKSSSRRGKRVKGQAAPTADRVNDNQDQEGQEEKKPENKGTEKDYDKNRNHK